jgi:hypothetical protein
MKLEAIEQAIRSWEKEHHNPVPPAVRRKIIEGYLPANERECRKILDTIHEAAVERAAR